MNAPEDDDAGFSLMETIIAMVIFALVATATAGVLVKAASLTSDNRGRAIASKIAVAKLDALRGGKYSSIVSGTATVVQAGKTFTVQTLVTPVFDDGKGGRRSCAAGGIGGQLYKKVGVAVSWSNTNQVKQIRNDTIVQNPGTSVDGSTGAVAVTVTDSGVGKSAPAPVGQIQVALSTGETAVTDDDGCAFFDGLTPMTTRTITVQRAGWIDNKNNNPATATVGVSAGLISSRQISFDQATNLNLTFGPTGQPLGTYATPALVSGGSTVPAFYTVVPTIGLNDATQRVFESLSTVTSNSDLEPFWPQDSGYSAWFGSCGQTSASVPPSIGNTAPGSTVAQSVPTGGVNVTIAPALVGRTLYFVNSSSDCKATPEVFSVPIAAGQTSAKVMLPFGTWQSGFLLASVSTPFTLTTAAPIGVISK